MIGDIHAKVMGALNFKEVFLKVYGRFFGVLDTHTHIRYNAIKPFIEKNLENYADVGAGSGYITVEIGKEVSGKVLGIVYENKDLITANKVSVLSKGNLSFKKGSILDLSTFNQQFDQVFCIDVLEHIEDDKNAIRNLKRILKPRGILVLSVPTPSYPKYFGDDFAAAVGHVRDGYSLNQISTLLKMEGLEVVDYKYHTKRFGKIIAKVCYKYHLFNKIPLSTLLLHPFFLVLCYLDKYVSTNDPLGLVVIAHIKGGST